MQLNEKGEVIWEPVNPEIVAIYDAALAYHLYRQNKKPETTDERR